MHQAAKPSSPTTLPAAGSNGAVQPAQLLELAQRPLRQALQDAPAAPPPPLALRLSGTVVEPGRSRAVMIGSDGKSQLRAIGDVVDGAELIDISADSVTVKYLGNPVVLKPDKGGG
jgi:predicted lipoprotein